MGDAVLSVLNQASNILFNLEQESGPGASLDPRQRACIKEVREKLDALKATPSQSDLEVAREWLFKHYGFRNLNVMSHEVDALAALIAASRGTRTLTEEEREFLADVAVRAPKDDLWPENDPDWAAGRAIQCREDRRNLRAIVSRLTGESST